MNPLSRKTALALSAVGPLLFLGAAIHPHAPAAKTMAEVAYVQTGRAEWWPAHVLLLAAEALFAVVLVSMSRAPGIPTALLRVLRWLVPIAVVSASAMLIHAILPLGRDSVAGAQEGWAYWVKDVVESLDALFAISVLVLAWTLWRNNVITNRSLSLAGVVGGAIFAVFSIAIPLFGLAIPMSVAHAVTPGLPVAGVVLAAIWSVGTGVVLVQRAP